jgi:hypothetical protein
MPFSEVLPLLSKITPVHKEGPEMMSHGSPPKVSPLGLVPIGAKQSKSDKTAAVIYAQAD